MNGHGSKSSHSPCSKTRHPAASTSQWRGGAMASSSIGYSLFSPTYISILKTPEPPTNPTTYCPTPNYSLSENVLFLSENFLPKIQNLELKTPILEEFRGNSRLKDFIASQGTSAICRKPPPPKKRKRERKKEEGRWREGRGYLVQWLKGVKRPTDIATVQRVQKTFS